MKKVITYGTFDLLHYGHIRILERAKKLGDYLVVGVTSDDFDKRRGKINVQQSLVERIKAVKETGLADEIIVEEYEGQKIDDIINLGIDVFTVGSDWKGKFDFLKDYCEVKYLSRTEGISSSEIRTKDRKLKLGFIGRIQELEKMMNAAKYVNGIEVVGLVLNNRQKYKTDDEIRIFNNYDEMLESIDAIYICSHPSKHYEQIEKAIRMKKHVLCESPVVLSNEKLQELYNLAKTNKCILMESIKTAYSTAYKRLLLLLKCGVIGEIKDVDVTCTSLKESKRSTWSSLYSWGPFALLPIFQILGTNYTTKKINSIIGKNNYDFFTKIDFTYKNAFATLKVGNGVKSEGQLIISGTKGYVYVPAPWWKTDYFEIRYENTNINKKYFYELNGEGLRDELVIFTKSIKENREIDYIGCKITEAITRTIEDFDKNNDTEKIYESDY